MSSWGWDGGAEDAEFERRRRQRVQVESRMDEQATTVRQCLWAVACQSPFFSVDVIGGYFYLGKEEWPPVGLMARLQELYPRLMDTRAQLTWYERADADEEHSRRGAIWCEALVESGLSEWWSVLDSRVLERLVAQQAEREAAEVQELADQEPSQERTEGGRAGDEHE